MACRFETTGHTELTIQRRPMRIARTLPFILAILFVFIANSSASPESSSRGQDPASDTEYHINVNGTDRTYFLHLPARSATGRRRWYSYFMAAEDTLRTCRNSRNSIRSLIGKDFLSPILTASIKAGMMAGASPRLMM